MLDLYDIGYTLEDEAYITKIYSDASYYYFCKALPGVALSTPSWQIKRMDSTGSTIMAHGDDNFDNPAIDLSTVQGLFA